jgi:hypothetical protein
MNAKKRPAGSLTATQLAEIRCRRFVFSKWIINLPCFGLSSVIIER